MLAIIFPRNLQFLSVIKDKNNALSPTFIHYELCGPFYDVIVVRRIAQCNFTSQKATQLMVYQGALSLSFSFGQVYPKLRLSYRDNPLVKAKPHC